MPWLKVIGPGSWGAGGRHFKAGEHWLDPEEDAHIIEIAEDYPQLVRFVNRPAPDGRRDPRSILEPEVLPTGPLTREDLGEVNVPEESPDDSARNLRVGKLAERTIKPEPRARGAARGPASTAKG